MTPAGQQVNTVWFAGKIIDTTNYAASPSSIPAGAWSSPASDRVLSAGSTRFLLIIFQDNLQASGYTLSVDFDNGCTVTASN
jgi:hypothetical protein